MRTAPRSRSRVEAADPYGEVCKHRRHDADVNEAPVAMDDPYPSTFEDTVTISRSRTPPIRTSTSRLPAPSATQRPGDGRDQWRHHLHAEQQLCRVRQLRLPHLPTDLTNTATASWPVTPVNDAPGFPGWRGASDPARSPARTSARPDGHRCPTGSVHPLRRRAVRDRSRPDHGHRAAHTGGAHGRGRHDRRAGTDQVDVVITVFPPRPVSSRSRGRRRRRRWPHPELGRLRVDRQARHRRTRPAATTRPSGLWSDGATLWLAENGDGADDAIYAYGRLGERRGHAPGGSSAVPRSSSILGAARHRTRRHRSSGVSENQVTTESWTGA